MKYRIICSVTSKSLMTPSRKGGWRRCWLGAPHHALGLRADGQYPLGPVSMATTDGSLITIPGAGR
jgi:hypothetical protein